MPRFEVRITRRREHGLTEVTVNLIDASFGLCSLLFVPANRTTTLSESEIEEIAALGSIPIVFLPEKTS